MSDYCKTGHFAELVGIVDEQIKPTVTGQHRAVQLDDIVNTHSFYIALPVLPLAPQVN